MSEIRAMLPGLIDPATAKETTARIKAALDAAPGGDPDGTLMLTVSVEAVVLAHAEYRRRGIPDEVFVSTMGCFPRFVAEHEASYGQYGFDREWWTWRQLSLRLFRLGELEFEYADRPDDLFLAKYADAAAETGSAKSDVSRQINIHIPSDAKLTPEACAESLRRARAFTERYFPDWSDAPMTCESWLLSPVLPDLLPADSNIVRFQSMFDVIGVESESEAWREWIFRRNPAPVAELPEDTSLQRAVKSHLLNGGAIGSGVGVLRE